MSDADQHDGPDSPTLPGPGDGPGGDGPPDPDAERGDAGAARPDAARELRNAVFSLKNAAGALFGNVQPAIKDVLDEADRVYRQAKASAQPAVSGVAEEAERMVKQIGLTAEPLARTVGSELHKLSDVMAEAVEGAVKGARGAVSAVREAATPQPGAEASAAHEEQPDDQGTQDDQGPQDDQDTQDQHADQPPRTRSAPASGVASDDASDASRPGRAPERDDD